MRPALLYKTLDSHVVQCRLCRRGCNFLCPGCQNWEIAHADVEKEIEKKELEGMAEWIRDRLGSETPWHVTDS